MKNSEILTVVLSGILSFIAATGGSYFASHLEQSNWEKRNEIELRKAMFEKRTEILERLITVENKAHLASGLELYYQYTMDLSGCKSKKDKSEIYACSNMNLSQYDKIMEMEREVDSLNADLGATITLANTYYGPETRKQIQECTNKNALDYWWKDNNLQEIQKIVATMAAEINSKPWTD